MTNQEKVNLVIARAKDILPGMKITFGDSVEGYAEFFKKSLLNMAEWKDQQFREYLEKKRKKYTTALSIALQKDLMQEAVVYDKMQCLLLEIINELFGE